MRDHQTAGIRDAVPLLCPYTRSLTSALLVGIVGSVVTAVQPQVISSIVDSFDGGLSASQIVAVVTLLLCSVLFTSFREYIVERAGERFAFDTRKRLIRHIYRLPIARFDGADRADLVSRVTNDVSEVRSILSSGLMIDIGVSGVTVVISVAMMLLIDSVLVAVAVITLIVVLLLVFALGMKMKPVGLRVQNELGRLSGTVSRSIGSIRTIKAALAIERQTTTAIFHAREVLKAGLKAAGLRAWIQSITGLSVQVLLITVVGLGSLRVASGAISTGQLSAFVMYLMMLVSPAVMVGSVTSQLGEALGALSRILEVEAWPDEPSVAEIKGGIVSVGSPSSVIEFRGVSFSYPVPTVGNRNVEVLRDVSFAVERGSTTALVGPSGAGKSTIFALIERFYSPSAGAIYFDGADVRSVSRDTIRSSLAYVDQDAAVIQGTIRDNLCLNRRAVSDTECADALLDVGLISRESEAEKYLRKEVGELGLGVSGGERQRLAVARSLLSGAPVLLLDEVTSSLDSKNESVVVDALRRKRPDRTVLVVAHRLSTVVKADRILLFDGGRLLDGGSHEELLSRSALYRDLANRQMIS